MSGTESLAQPPFANENENTFFLVLNFLFYMQLKDSAMQCSVMQCNQCNVTGINFYVQCLYTRTEENPICGGAFHTLTVNCTVNTNIY